MVDSLWPVFWSAFWPVFLIGLLVWGLLGHLVGRTKGRPQQGTWLGLAFGVFGVLAVGIMDPPDGELRRRQRLLADPRDPTTVGPFAGGYSIAARSGGFPSRTEMVAQALRHNPSLADASTPGAAARMQVAVEVIAADYQFQADLDAARAYEANEAAALADAERLSSDRQAQARHAQEASAQAAAQAAEREAAHAAKLASLHPFPRWLSVHRPLVVSAVVLAVLALVITGLWFGSRAQVVAGGDVQASSSAGSAAGFSGTYMVTTKVTETNQDEPATAETRSYSLVVARTCSGGTCSTTAVGDGATLELAVSDSGFHTERAWQGSCTSGNKSAGEARWTTITDMKFKRVVNGKVKSLTGTSRSSQLEPCPGQSGPMAVISYSVKIDSL